MGYHPVASFGALRLPGTGTTIMKLTIGNLRVLVIACGVVLIGFGLAKGLFHFDLGERAESWITNGLFVVAALGFLQMFKLRRQARDAARKP